MPAIAPTSLGTLVLRNLRKTTASSAWSNESLTSIQTFLKDLHTLKNVSPAEQAIRAWITTIPQSDSDILQTALPNHPTFLYIISPALLV